GVRAHWLPDDRFWYRNTVVNGTEFVLFDPALGARSPAFDHSKVAAAASAATGITCDAHHLPFTEFDFSRDGRTISFSIKDRLWKCDLQTYQCTSDGGVSSAAQRSGAPARGRRH